MKKRIIAILILLPMLAASAFAHTAETAPAEGKEVIRKELLSEIAKIKACEGADVLKLGSVKTAAIKTLILANIEGNTEEDRAVRAICRGMKDLVIADWKECPEANRQIFNRRLDRIIARNEPIIEMKDKGESVSIYAVVDEANDQICDFVMYSAKASFLMCIIGKFDLGAIASLLQ